MSTIHARFTVNTQIAKACDDESFRFSLGNVLITKADPGYVFATASDGRQVSIARYEGETDAPYYAPPAAMAAPKRGATVALNGSWENLSGTPSKPKRLLSDRVETDLRYPRIDNVLPDVNRDNFVPVTLSVNLLRKMADSIVGVDEDAITLFVPDQKNGVTSPIVAVAQNGIGVIMPMTCDAKNTLETYNFRRDCYRQHFDDPTQS